MITNRFESHLASERGAVIVHVTIALVGLLAFSAFVIDYGVMWTARRQAQNAADAAALAGAISLAYVDFDNQDLARQSALAVATQHTVWGEVPDITAADITFPACPPGSPGAGTNSCVRVDVFRNQRAGGSPLPTIFAKLVGVDDQGVRATATAEALFGDSTNCVKPLAIPDKWQETMRDVGPAGWDETDTFERFFQTGNSKGELITPGVPDAWDPGTGYTPESVSLGGGDYGRYITLYNSSSHDTVRAGWYHPVRLGASSGASDWGTDMVTCNPTFVGPGTVLDVENGRMVGPAASAIESLTALDPLADWDPTLYDGRGGVKGGCMATGDCAVSPRLVAIPVYDPDAYNALTATTGDQTLRIVKIVGFFMDRNQANGDMKGWITSYPAEANAGMGGEPGDNFVVSVALVR